MSDFSLTLVLQIKTSKNHQWHGKGKHKIWENHSFWRNVCLYTVIFLPRKEKFARKRVNFRRFSLLYFRYVIQRESVENKLQKWICPICFCPICPTCLERDRWQVSVQRVIWTGTSVHSFGSMNQPLWFNKFARICSNLLEFARIFKA